MCIPPFDDKAKIHFEKLKNIRDELNPNLKLSMGMSADYPLAVRFGATHIRVGTAIFGNRRVFND